MVRESTVEYVGEVAAGGDPGRVVVGVSGSLASLAALRAGAAEARRSGRTLVAVHAWEPPEGEGLYLRHPDRVWAALWKTQARICLDRAFDEAFGGDPQGVTVRRLVVRDRPGPALCKVAHRESDVLLLGTRPSRRTGAPRGRGGKVARHVRRRAACTWRLVPGPARPRGVRRALRGLRADDFRTAPAPTAGRGTGVGGDRFSGG
ncbi:universal stress protein [Streptomyces sp. LHD-70]|uniref:universal stress protein n=1 Tax=Streptomyces sp. LHD-70 TaxID=3072140 RepID=UPI00280CD4E6|nr:universal stress protein [Streptomyces sp. LHD-70]MDQ8705505.1 universal stress protein [Streptomyces sp. LHD-70]